MTITIMIIRKSREKKNLKGIKPKNRAIVLGECSLSNTKATISFKCVMVLLIWIYVVSSWWLMYNLVTNQWPKLFYALKIQF